MSENGLIVTNAHVVSSSSPGSGQQHLKVLSEQSRVQDIRYYYYIIIIAPLNLLYEGDVTSECELLWTLDT